MSHKLLLLLLFTFITCLTRCQSSADRCLFGKSCFPGHQEITEFKESLKGHVLLPSDSDYSKETKMHNLVFTKEPGIVVLVQSTNDVRKSVLFAREHNLRVTIFSSGHDFIGRSTGDGTLQINLSNMRNMTINLNSPLNAAGIITVESGAPWVEVYKKLDNYDRVVVGGSAHTVSQGGYTQGGGHSPISRSLGLAVDQVLEMTVVTSNGTIVTTNNYSTMIEDVNGTVYNASDNDLFWALRGGGGGTYGIVTSYTYKLHYEPEQMVVATFSYLLSYDGYPYIGNEVIKFYNSFVKTMPKEWGGYVLMSNTRFWLPGGHYCTGVLFFFNHFGAWNLPSRQAIHQWETFRPEWRTFWQIKNVSSFWEYEQNVTDVEYYNTYLMNTFIQPKNLDDNFADFLSSEMTKAITDSEPLLSCTGVHIGGKVSEAESEDTPVHPGFRSGLVSLTCGVPIDPGRMRFSEKKGIEFYNNLKKFGNGVYLNEPSANLSDWKNQFWGKHYDRLLSIKRKWDPDNFFTCRYCVGCDESPGGLCEAVFSSSTRSLFSFILMAIMSLLFAFLE